MSDIGMFIITSPSQMNNSNGSTVNIYLDCDKIDSILNGLRPSIYRNNSMLRTKMTAVYKSYICSSEINMACCFIKELLQKYSDNILNIYITACTSFPYGDILKHPRVSFLDKSKYDSNIMSDANKIVTNFS